MSTHSTIAILKADNTVESIYCHSDGQLTYNGICLFTYYQELQKIKDLISLGNLSTLNQEVHPQTPNHTFDSKEPKVSTFYSRDRKEIDQNADKFHSLHDFLTSQSFYEYLYLYKEKNKKWYFLDNKTQKFVPLKTQLKQLEPKKIYHEFRNDFFQELDKDVIIKRYKQLYKETPIINTSDLKSQSNKNKL